VQINDSYLTIFKPRKSCGDPGAWSLRMTPIR